MYISDQFQEFVECMYLKSLESSTSDAKPSNTDVLSWVDQAYKMLKQQKVKTFLKLDVFKAVRYNDQGSMPHIP